MNLDDLVRKSLIQAAESWESTAPDLIARAAKLKATADPVTSLVFLGSDEAKQFFAILEFAADSAQKTARLLRSTAETYDGGEQAPSDDL